MEPFGPDLSVFASDSLLYWAFGSRFEIRTHASDGSLRRISRAHIVATPIHESERKKYFDALGKGLPDALRTRLVEAQSNVPFPKTYPVLDRILGGPNGIIWARLYSVGNDSREHWMVLDPEGKLVAQVRMPDGFACHAITSRGILGVASNDLGTQQVQLLAVEKARF